MIVDSSDFNGSDTQVANELINKKISEVQLELHRRDGHRHFLPECAECRPGAIKQRPHRRLPELLRPGGELSVDLSGPHFPGRFPSDLQEFYAVRPPVVPDGGVPYDLRQRVPAAGG